MQHFCDADRSRFMAVWLLPAKELRVASRLTEADDHIDSETPIQTLSPLAILPLAPPVRGKRPTFSVQKTANKSTG